VPVARTRSEVDTSATIDLVTGIVDDARTLVAAYVEALRDDLSSRLVLLGATLAATLIAIGVFMVTALLLSLAVAASLVAFGVPWWLSLWAVTLAVGAIGIGFALRARAKAHAHSLHDFTLHTTKELA
jgi:hypothetical protein